MSTKELRSTLRQRVRVVTRQMWALHVGRGVAQTAVVAVALVAAVAAIDYLVELPLLARVTLFAVGLTAVAVLATQWVVRPALRWGRSRVAVVLEGLFPRLGQRLRTALEHGNRSSDELTRAGVAPALVAALEDETAEKAKPLPFQAALPVRPMLFATGVSLLCIAVLVAAAERAPEWRTALRRVALSSESYTALSATPSAGIVDEGADVDVLATISGRARPAVVLHVREVGDPDWREEAMDQVDGGFTARVAKLRSTTEFFVSAGPESTSAQQIVVRRPLKIESAHIEVRSPAYTGVALATHDIGSFSAIQGSTAQLQFDLDRQPTTAVLVIKDPTKPGAAPHRKEMAIQGRQISVELPLAADIEYAIDARDANDVGVVANRFRVRVTADQPPTVWFEVPSENMEVHTLAEILMRARARDDFGISRVGIVFQVNNEEERTLVVHDVKEPFQRAALAEQMILLEQFLLTEKDCVAYYAFAEDNRPGTPQRVTTELRFIDIRPFKRIYELRDPGEPMDGPKRDLIFLDEVITRQRFNLNQTIRLETRSKARLDVAQVDKVAAFENKLATQTHDLIDFLTSVGVDGTALLTQAEETMLSAVDSLQGAKFTTAIGQERDALRYLMEARNTIRQILLKKSPQVRAQARAFDRLQKQKLRQQPEKSETLTALATELIRLADEEDDVSRLLAAAGNTPTGPGTAGDKRNEPATTTSDKPDMNKPGPGNPDKPDMNKPGPGNPDNPDPTKPGSANPDPTKPDPTKPGSANPDPTKPGSGNPDPDKPGGGKPDPTKPSSGNPDPDKTGGGKPDPDKTGGGKPDSTKPGSGNPDSDKTGGGKPDPEKSTADKSGAGSPQGKPGPETADPLQERQDDIAGRAALLDKTAATAKGLTGLAKTRIADAAKAANASADALGQRDRATAQKEADRAREIFRTAGKQVAALAAEEAAQQLAAARDLANDIAMQAAAADPTRPTGPGAGTGKGEPMPGAKSGADKGKAEPMPGAKSGADKGDPMSGLKTAAENAKTLKDVLEQIAGSGSESSAEAARRAGELLKGEDLAAAIKRLETPGTGGDRTERQDLADRFAALGQKLDQAYRDLIAPRLEEIARLEAEATALEKRLASAEDDEAKERAKPQIAEFVERLEAARLGQVVDSDLRNGLKAGPNRGGDQLKRGLASVRDGLVAKLQEFVAGDRFTTGDEAVPPEYKDLVDRYLRTLSAGSTK